MQASDRLVKSAKTSGHTYVQTTISGNARVQQGDQINIASQKVTLRIEGVTSLAWRMYKSCKTAPESYGNISSELVSLHAVLKECEEVFPERALPANRSERLAIITTGCSDVLDELDTIVKKYESLGLQQKWTWDRMKWHSHEINDIRSRLISHTSMLTAFLSTSQVRVEQKLEALLLEFRRGNTDGSVVSSITVDSLAQDERAQWREVRKEFESHGITLETFSVNRNFIFEWLAEAVAAGKFDEMGEGDSDPGPNLHTEDAGLASAVNVLNFSRPRSAQHEANPEFPLTSSPASPRSIALEANSAGSQPRRLSSYDKSTSVSSLYARKDVVVTQRKAPRVALMLAKLSNPSSKMKSLVEHFLKYHKYLSSDPQPILDIVLDDAKRELLSQHDLSSALFVLCFAQRCLPTDLELIIDSGGDVNIPIDFSPYVHSAHVINRRPLDAIVLGGTMLGSTINQTWQVEALIKAGANPDLCSVMALAAERHDFVLTSKLLEEGANINREGYLHDGQECTPLMAAISHYQWSLDHRDRENFIDLLLNNGADVTANETHLPLRVAIESEQLWLCEKLLKAGADPNAGDPKPLKLAVERQNIEVCPLLLKNGADPNGQLNQDGLTVMKLADILSYRYNPGSTRVLPAAEKHVVADEIYQMLSAHQAGLAL